MTVNAVPLRFPSMPAVVGLVPVELDDTAHGRKRLWLWPLEDATMRVSPER